MSVVTFVMLLGTFGLFWYGILVLRQSVATARMTGEVAKIRAELVDAIFDGEIQPNNAAAADLIEWADIVLANPREFNLGEGLAILHACRKAGVTVPNRKDLQGMHQATPAGRKAIHKARTDLDNIMGWYMIRNSALWWIIAPVQRLGAYILERRVRRVQVLREQVIVNKERRKQTAAATDRMIEDEETLRRHNRVAATKTTNPTVISKGVREATMRHGMLRFHHGQFA